jgi:hypothetical protein
MPSQRRRMALCLVSPKTNSPSPAQRQVHAAAKKAISCYETRQPVSLILFSFLWA